ncbi:hypothetical protein Cni_G20573 [Canna indica]|uniref:J domain-containing protein n=1 Tax=Canna indica TaxID=4628 RepID=A0AAQ3KP80_9LILI|nr:hypothetical protein Cni_G20573 [Canna indica]
MAQQTREEEAGSKAQLVREICSTGSVFASCTHRRRSPRKASVFVDWYLILRVDEDAKFDVIRKRYCQLALQIHPDKNKQPEANVAFNLVSEAYACLSDKAKRKAFSLERRNNFCKECYKNSHLTICHGNKQKPSKSTGYPKQNKSLHTLRELQKRFMEECEVIESCLISNKACRREEYPLFNPCDQLPGYPHLRQGIKNPTMNRWHFNTSHVQDQYRRCSRSKKGDLESPVFEIGMKNCYPTNKNYCF